MKVMGHILVKRTTQVKISLKTIKYVLNQVTLSLTRPLRTKVQMRRFSTMRKEFRHVRINLS